VQLRGINIKKILTVIAISLFLGGCTWLNPFLYFQGESGDSTTLPVATDELIEFAQYCDYAYNSATVENKLYEIRNDEFSYHVMQDMGVTILIFRGTNNTKNILTDIDMRPVEDAELGVILHRGFRDAASWLLEDIKKNYKLEKTVYLTGHSLGGAVAQIIGLWLDNDGYTVQIYTFGSPKVSTTFFGNRPPHYRVAMRSDPVPFLPPYPFLHSGIRIDPETLDWMEGGETDRDSFTKIDGLDHSIHGYFKALLNSTGRR
jgi:hypothetical protein